MPFAGFYPYLSGPKPQSVLREVVRNEQANGAEPVFKTLPRRRYRPYARKPHELLKVEKEAPVVPNRPVEAGGKAVGYTSPPVIAANWFMTVDGHENRVKLPLGARKCHRRETLTSAQARETEQNLKVLVNKALDANRKRWKEARKAAREEEARLKAEAPKYKLAGPPVFEFDDSQAAPTKRGKRKAEGDDDDNFSPGGKKIKA